MNKGIKKICLVVIAVIILSGAFAGCGNPAAIETTPTVASAATQTAAPAVATVAVDKADEIFEEFYKNTIDTDSITPLLEKLNEAEFISSPKGSALVMEGKMSLVSTDANEINICFPDYTFDGEEYLDISKSNNTMPNVILENFIKDVYEFLKKVAQHPEISEEGTDLTFNISGNIKAYLYDANANQFSVNDVYTGTYSADNLKEINWDNMDKLIDADDYLKFSQNHFSYLIGTFNSGYSIQWYLDNNIFKP
jgi:hypothetical protein